MTERAKRASRGNGPFARKAFFGKIRGIRPWAGSLGQEACFHGTFEEGVPSARDAFFVCRIFLTGRFSRRPPTRETGLPAKGSGS
ncbi:MAG: hypothetical protein C6P37_08910 [Caldibacillus debilis]|uniref:Uncharacterized protein n=1 Tax=Caldibacillus debilis TaxID=301148 RepID=A0A3E0K3Y6_9BACI|nr:MAG: hypothetical protein C6P37_08910 [Caldibacillus debilis]